MTTPRHPKPSEAFASPSGLARIESVPAFASAGTVVRARWETGPGAGQLVELPLADFLDVFDGPITR